MQNPSNTLIIVLAALVWVYAFIRFTVALLNWVSRTLLPLSEKATTEPLVSVLIPARNEEKSLPALLDDLNKMQYQNLEILVYDDSSEDKTAEIVSEKKTIDSRIRLLKGISLPEGWLGKNHACHRLASEAGGEYLLFLDADVRVSPELIGHSLNYLRKYKLNLLSIFPQQIMKSFGERISIPLMNWILTSMLPLPLIRRNAWPSFAAANGQFMLFEARHYHCNKWHQLVRSDMVEDIHIMQYSKSGGYRNHTLLSKGQIRCRMYSGAGEAINGFAKNVLAFFGNSIPFALFHVLATTAGIFPFFFLSLPWQISWLSLILLIRISTSAVSRQNPLLNILLMPLQQVVLLFFFVKAVFIRYGRNYKWKGRPVQN